MKKICREKNNICNGEYLGYFLLTVGKEYTCITTSINKHEYLVINDCNFSYSYPVELFCTKKEYRKLKLQELKKVSEL